MKPPKYLLDVGIALFWGFQQQISISPGSPGAHILAERCDTSLWLWPHSQNSRHCEEFQKKQKKKKKKRKQRKTFFPVPKELSAWVRWYYCIWSTVCSYGSCTQYSLCAVFGGVFDQHIESTKLNTMFSRKLCKRGGTLHIGSAISVFLNSIYMR